MATLVRERLEAPPLTEAEQEMLRAAQRVIMGCLDHSRAARITVESDDGSTPTVSVPPAVMRVIGDVLGLMARRQPIVLVPEKQEVSTVEAANLLNVSRPFLIKELEAGKLPHRKVGSHRRILYDDLMTYAREMRKQQQQALEQMAANARELGLEY